MHARVVLGVGKGVLISGLSLVERFHCIYLGCGFAIEWCVCVIEKVKSW